MMMKIEGGAFRQLGWRRTKQREEVHEFAAF